MRGGVAAGTLAGIAVGIPVGTKVGIALGMAIGTAVGIAPGMTPGIAGTAPAVGRGIAVVLVATDGGGIWGIATGLVIPWLTKKEKLFCNCFV